jgi:hypothetical protein
MMVSRIRNQNNKTKMSKAIKQTASASAAALVIVGFPMGVFAGLCFILSK